MKTRILTYIFVLIALAWFSGCSGSGSGGGGTGGSATGGVGGTGVISAGLITATGSITVNGVKYETEDARIFMDDEEVLDDRFLKVGMVVEVEGEINDDGTTGTAALVRFDDSVEGPVAAVNTDTLVMEILGQTVVVDAQTIFDDSGFTPANINGVTVGDVVEVSGQVDDKGNIRATRVEKTTSAIFEITGIVSGLANSTFTINGLTVDFSSAVLEDFPVGAPTNGDLVEVKGSAYDKASNTLTATRVENKARTIADDVEVEIESFVVALTAGGFSISSPFGVLSVVYDASTEFRGGAATDILVGTKVEVEGYVQGNVLVADEITLKENVRVEVAASGADGSSLTIELRSLSALTVFVNSLTELDDKRAAPVSTSDIVAFLNSINADDHLRVRGREIGNGRIAAVELEVDDPDYDKLDEVDLRGPVDATPTDTMSFAILGIQIDTSSASSFKDRMESEIGRSAFFESIQAGTTVEAQGVFSADNAIDAEELELED